MRLPRLGLIARISLLVLFTQITAFGALGWFYVDHFINQDEQHLHGRIRHLGQMLASGDLALNAIARRPYMSDLLEAPYLNGVLLDEARRVRVSSDPSQLGQPATGLDWVSGDWLDPQPPAPRFLLQDEVLTAILPLTTEDRSAYTLILRLSKAEVLAEKRRIILWAGLGSLLFILLSGLAVVAVTYGFNRSAREVRQIKRKLEQVLWSSGDGWWDWDLSNNRVYFDERCTAMLGFGQQAFGQDLDSAYQRIHPDDLEQVKQAVRQHLHGHSEDFNSSLRMQCRDGSWLWVMARGKLAERDAQGQPLRMTGTLSDISERKRLEASIQESFEIYQAAINTSALGFWVADLEGRLLEVNQAYCRQSGYSSEELLQLSIADLVAEGDVARCLELIRGESYAQFRTEHRHRDGSLWPVEVMSTYSPVQGGRYFAFIEDISALVEQERELQLAHQVFHNIDQAVVVTDARNRIISVNPATSQITGYSVEELQGQDPKIFSSGRQSPEFYRQMWHDIQHDGHWEGEIWDRHKSGRFFPKWLSIDVIHGQDGQVRQYVSIFKDITERKKSEELIWRQANFDALTGLANRNLFHSRLQQELAHAVRNNKRLAVLFLDLDGFKHVNDSLGHAAGDELLIEVGKRLQGRIRKTDTVARLGGDEFTLLVLDVERPERVASLAEQVLDALREPLLINQSRIHISGSIGIALYPDDGDTMDALTKHADTAMYQAKASGKNAFQFFMPEMNVSAGNRLALIHDLHQAVAEQAFQLYYQPKFRLSDQTLVGMEALVRWPRPEGGMVSPADFIPCAEETGLILPLGRWVLGEACRQTQIWNRQYGMGLKVAVNFSAKQFRNINFLAELGDALEGQGLAAEFLELEITESALMGNVEEAINLMHLIRDRGITIAIDDFGTGYSSLNYLKSFPINTLKIDQSFVRDLTVDSEDAAIVRSIISLAESLGLDVVAEGLERAEHLKFLKAHGCEYGQGYYLGKPLPAEQFGEFLANRGQRTEDRG
ncbi:MAG: EAL domain-containing protein [Gammaproteobacteria bacterium SHHR-1]|uniref:sensor domain-containing protein n=1 Tax=Magnetovirga frankeli TaxID=947516 RepID=UPI0012938F57|nr:EAL domain-containing protein [gamma proteobacterium SS-5]